jgi:predicted aconitase
MKLTAEQQAMLAGEYGKATRKAMEILATLGEIYGAERMLPVTSVQVAGVSYDNLGEAGLQFLSELVEGGGKARVLTTLNPAGMDVENWKALGIDPLFAKNQIRVLDAFERMGVVTTCTCTPYLSGNLPHFGEHIAWSESSAVCYANSVLGARTNREGGPSALAAALTGFTPAYGMHLDMNRLPDVLVEVPSRTSSSPEEGGNLATFWFGGLGKAIGARLEGRKEKAVPYIRGIEGATLEELKSFCASIATYAGTALFHMHGITPEAGRMPIPDQSIRVSQDAVEMALDSLNVADTGEVDFVSLGCPHLSIKEVARVAELLDGKKVVREFWITTARPTKQVADRMGYTRVIEASGAKFAVDTCCVVAPIRGRFHALATDSAKACYYAMGKNGFKTRILPFEHVVREALGELE